MQHQQTPPPLLADEGAAYFSEILKGAEGGFGKGMGTGSSGAGSGSSVCAMVGKLAREHGILGALFENGLQVHCSGVLEISSFQNMRLFFSW